MDIQEQAFSKKQQMMDFCVGNQGDRFLILHVMKHLSFFGKFVDECVRKTCYS